MISLPRLIRWWVFSDKPEGNLKKSELYIEVMFGCTDLPPFNKTGQNLLNWRFLFPDDWTLDGPDKVEGRGTHKSEVAAEIYAGQLDNSWKLFWVARIFNSSEKSTDGDECAAFDNSNDRHAINPQIRSMNNLLYMNQKFRCEINKILMILKFYAAKVYFNRV